jgi:hypothetical protein
MTTPADDPAVEDAFEALLAGRPVPEEAAGLAAFTAAVRTTATSPGRPNAALADLLATGLLVDQTRPSARTATSPGATRPRARNRRRFAMFFPALLAKFLSAGAVAQAATGATVVVVAFAGAGAAGVLPGPVQDTFTSIVSDETEAPVEEPPVDEVADEEAPAEEAPLEEAPAGESAEQDPAEVVAAWMAAPIDGSFGDWVSAARHDPALMAAIEESGYNFGHYVSERAHQKGLTEEDLADEGVDLDELTEDGTVVEDAPEADGSEGEVAETEQTTPEQGNRGNRGHGDGDGGGNRGNGSGGGNGNGNGRN